MNKFYYHLYYIKLLLNRLTHVSVFDDIAGRNEQKLSKWTSTAILFCMCRESTDYVCTIFLPALCKTITANQPKVPFQRETNCRFHSLMVWFVRGWNEKLVASAKWGFIQRLAAWLGRDWWSHSDKFFTARMRLSLDMLFHWTSSLHCYLDHYWQTVKHGDICFVRAEA